MLIMFQKELIRKYVQYGEYLPFLFKESVVAVEQRFQKFLPLSVDNIYVWWNCAEKFWHLILDQRESVETLKLARFEEGGTYNWIIPIFYIFSSSMFGDRHQSIHLIVILVWKGKGPFVNPTSGSRDGGESPTQENLKFFKMFDRNRKFSILARVSPRHFLLPIPKGWSISLFSKLPSSFKNLSGLKYEF